MEVKLEYKPHEAQQRAHQSLAKYILYGGAVGGGKTIAIVNDALSYCLGWTKNRVGIFRWENTSFTKTTFTAIEEYILSVEGLVNYHNRNERRIVLCNGSEIIYGGLKPSSSVSMDMYSTMRSLEMAEAYVDEATDMPEKAYIFLCTRLERIKAVNARTGILEHPPYRMFITSNPELGWIKTRFIDQQLADHEFIPAKATDNPHLSENYISTLEHQMSHIPGWREKYVEGDWGSVVDFDSIFRSDRLTAAVNRRVDPGEPVEFGVDVASSGDDKTVVAMRRGYNCDIIWVSGEPDTMVSANQVAMLADKYHPNLIKVDSIGEGKGVYNRLAEMGYNVTGFVGGAKPVEEGYLNLRAEAYFELKALLDKGMIQLPNIPELINEMGQIKFMRSGTDKNVQIESKKNIKKRLGHSPDYVDAVVYAFSGAMEGTVTSVLI